MFNIFYSYSAHLMQILQFYFKMTILAI
jgi:hypothetical protein